MAVTEVVEVGEGRELNEDARQNSLEGKRTFHAYTDDPTDTQFTVLASLLLPQVYSDHPQSDRVKVIRRAAKQHSEDDRKWTVEIQYSSQYGNPNNNQENPLDRPAQISVDTTDYKKPLVRDLDGELVSNGAGVAYDPPITADRHHITLTVVKNFSTSGEGDLPFYMNAINEDVFMDYLPLCVKLSRFRSQQQFDGTFGEYWVRTYTFEVLDPDEDEDYSAEDDNSPWDEVILNAGFHSIDAAALLDGQYRLIPFYDAGGAPVKKYLDIDGQETDTAEYLRFRKYRRRTFASLGLFS